MIKKLALVAEALAIAAPAFASYGGSSAVTNNGSVHNAVVTISNTGVNIATGGTSRRSSGGTVLTGAAVASVNVGTTLEVVGSGRGTVTNNGGVSNLVLTGSNSGFNSASGKGAVVSTGPATSGVAVNTTIVVE